MKVSKLFISAALLLALALPAPPAAAHPDSVVTIDVVDPAVYLVYAGQTVNLRVTETNTGTSGMGGAYLTKVSVTVNDGTSNIAVLRQTDATWDDGTGDDDAVLEIGETWTWMIYDVPVYATTTFTATGTGRAPSGIWVTYPDYPTERDAVTVETIDLLPGFTLTKQCAQEPVQFGDDAVFDIELANTGNVDLIVVLDEDVVDTLGVIVTAGGTIGAGDPFTLPAGQTLEATVAIPATTYPFESNTITALITLPEWTGRSDSWTPTASDSCNVIGMCSSETAYGLNDALSPTCFNTLGFDNWGWTNGPMAYDGIYTFALWAGAAHCNTGNGTYAGTVTIDYTGTGAKGYSITYNLENGFEIVEEHVYIGKDQVPKVKEGKKTVPTVAPGQYYVTKGIHRDSIYIIYHAVVEWCE